MIIGIAWSLWFKKKFSSSLAPAYMTHILFVLLSGLVLKKLSIGIYVGVVFATVFLVVYFFKHKLKPAATFWNIMLNEGGMVFTTFYLFCFILNFKKCFISWDEFSHWGMFLKESLRLDCLYCMSPLSFSHKDYVPAMTLFETIWCKLSFRYAESDVYRAIQAFMFSMLMPLSEYFGVNNLEDLKGIRNTKANKRFIKFTSIVIIFLIPLLFNTSNAFYFYHSIYCDIALGILLYWCVFEVYKNTIHNIYTDIILTIGISVLVLTKQTAMALIPLVIGLILFKFIGLSKWRGKGKPWFIIIPMTIVPSVLWIWFNTFVKNYMDGLDGRQSYGGMKLSSIKEVFTNPQHSTISYLKVLKNAYIDAIIHRDILIHGSYAVVIIFIVISFVIITQFVNDKDKKISIIIAGIWTGACSIYYALLMYFLYATAFSEYEVKKLASYERYMNTFVLAAIFLLLAVYYDSQIWKNHIRGLYFVLLFMVLDLSFLHVSAFDQMLPGNITRDIEKMRPYTNCASEIVNSTASDSGIYIIKRGDNGDFLFRQRYYCSPRRIGGGSIGPMVDEGDIFSKDISVAELVETLSDYDYIYFSDLDEAFQSKYSDAFEDPSKMVSGHLYKITCVDSKVRLE